MWPKFILFTNTPYIGFLLAIHTLWLRRWGKDGDIRTGLGIIQNLGFKPWGLLRSRPGQLHVCFLLLISWDQCHEIVIKYDIPYTKNLKRNVQMNLFTKQRQTHRLRTWTYGCQREEREREFGMVMYTLLYLKWIANKVLLYSTGNSTRWYGAA